MDWNIFINHCLNYIGFILSLVGTLFAIGAWAQAKKVNKNLEREKEIQNKKVAVVLLYGDEKIPLPVKLTRSELTRSEVLGRIGMIPTKSGGRFKLSHLNTIDFMDQIIQIKQAEKEGLLIISCTKEEFNQFDFPKTSVS